MRPVDDDDSSLQLALSRAVATCRERLADYRAGILDEGELRFALSRAGLVVRGDEAWLLVPVSTKEVSSCNEV